MDECGFRSNLRAIATAHGMSKSTMRQVCLVHSKAMGAKANRVSPTESDCRQKDEPSPGIGRLWTVRISHSRRSFAFTLFHNTCRVARTLADIFSNLFAGSGCSSWRHPNPSRIFSPCNQKRKHGSQLKGAR